MNSSPFEFVKPAMVEAVADYFYHRDADGVMRGEEVFNPGYPVLAMQPLEHAS